LTEDERRQLHEAFDDAAVIYRENRDIVRRDGYTAKGACGGVIKAPHHDVMRDAARTMAMISRALGYPVRDFLWDRL
jgi:hypothetical protein